MGVVVAEVLVVVVVVAAAVVVVVMVVVSAETSTVAGEGMLRIAAGEATVGASAGAAAAAGVATADSDNLDMGILKTLILVVGRQDPRCSINAVMLMNFSLGFSDPSSRSSRNIKHSTFLPGSTMSDCTEMLPPSVMMPHSKVFSLVSDLTAFRVFVLISAA